MTEQEQKPKRTRAPRRSQGAILAERVSKMSIEEFILVQAAVREYHDKMKAAVAP